MISENKEIWKDIARYTGEYQVSNIGNVRSVTRLVKFKHTVVEKEGTVLVPFINSHGYKIVKLYTMGRGKNNSVHRLVAEAFIPNPEWKHDVNHMDGDKTNNVISNLEWATRSENEKHAFRIGLKKPTCTGMKGINHWSSKAVEMLNCDGEIINVYNSQREASTDTGIKQCDISRLCKTKKNDSFGNLWRIKNEI